MELNWIAADLGLAVETGVFSGEAPGEYLVIVPMADTFAAFADDRPGFETQEARLSLFSKGSYTARKKALTTALLAADFTITSRLYVGREDDTGYHHFAIDVAKVYRLED
jgi:hypothetical protein